MTGTVVRVKGLKRYFEPKTGKWYNYHRASGRRIEAEFGTPAFFAELAAIEAESKGKKAVPGTLGALIGAYRASAAFQTLRPRTQADYQKLLDFLQPLDASPLSQISAPWVAKLRDKTFVRKKRRFTNYLLAVLSLLFEYGIEQGLMSVNHAKSVKQVRKAKDAPEANRPWTDAERDAVSAALPAHMRLPVALMMFCGLDPQDALLLPRTAISEGKLDTRRGKTGVPVWTPLPAPVVAAIEAAPAHDAETLCASSQGKTWTVSGFRASWRPIRMKLEKNGAVQPGLTLKGLRHTVATILREMGKEPATIAMMLGHKTEAMARHYSRRADMTKQMAETVAEFDAEMAKRREK